MRKPPRATVTNFVPSRDYGQRAVYQGCGAWHVPVMLAFLLAAIIVAPNDRAAPRSASAQAQVSIRIISGARIQLGRSSEDEAALIHRAAVRLDGRLVPASLIEFR